MLQIDRWLIPGAVAACLFFFAGLGVFLKVRPATPDHIEPVVKISLFDHFQSWSLARSAESLEEQGKLAEAKAGWSLAAANNPGDLRLLRRTLGVLRKEVVTPQTGRESAIFGIWLLRLAQTNRTDLKLVLETLEHNRRYREIGLLLEGEKDSLTSDDKAMELRSLFHFSQYRSFRRLWESDPELFIGNPLMRLYHLGVNAILDRQAEDFAVLRDAYSALGPYDPHFLRSRQIALRAHAAGQHTRTCRRLLKDLVDRRMATLPDHLFYWHMLIRNGLGDSISEEVERAGDPATELEAVILARTLHMAGLKEASALAAQKALQVFGAGAPGLWLHFGNQLARDREWHQLNALAQQVYRQESVSELIGPMAQYWEALTAWHSDRPDKAEALFQAIAHSPPDSPQMRFGLATRLLSLGQEEAADMLVEGLDGKIADVQTYWGIRVGSAVLAKDLQLFSEIAEAAYESDPEFVPHMNNYLSALLGQRREPELALELSEKLIKSDPDQIAFRLNRAHALCLNEKWDGAEAILDRIGPQEIENLEVAGDYQLALFRLAVGRGDREMMLRLRKTIDLKQFMPATGQWIEEALKESKE